MPELGSYGSVGAGEGNLSLYPEFSKFIKRLSAVLLFHRKNPHRILSYLETLRNVINGSFRERWVLGH